MNYGIYAPEDPKAGLGKLPRGAAMLSPDRSGARLLFFHDPHLSFADRCRQAAKQGRPVELGAEERESLVLVGYWLDYEGEVRLSPGAHQLLSGLVGKPL